MSFIQKFTFLIFCIFCTNVLIAQTPMDTIVGSNYTLIVPKDITVDCGSVPAMVAPTVQTNCPISKTAALFDEYMLEEDCSSNYTIYRLWTVYTPCQESFDVFQEVYVHDSKAPVFSNAPSDITTSCTTIPAVPNVTVSDNCSTQTQLLFSETTTVLSAYSTKILRTWTASDPCGNSCVHNQKITIADTKKPTFVYKTNDITVECSAVPAPTTPKVSDDCDKTPIILYKESKLPAGCYDAYYLKREWTVKDKATNSTTTTQMVYVQDKRAPLFTPPANITVECNNIPAVALPADLKISDNCTKNVTIKVTQIDKNIICPNKYDMVRVYTVSDRCNNKTTKSQTIFIRDTKAPIVTSPIADVTVSCTNIPTLVNPTATDNCSSVNTQIAESVITTNCVDNYTIKRTWTLKDACSNSTTVTSNITVIDTQNPTFASLIPDVTLAVSSGVLPNLSASANDNCDKNVAISFSESLENTTPTSGNNQCTKYVVRTWLASDNCNNTALATQNLYIQDDVAPVILNTPADITLQCSEALPPAPTNIVAIDTMGIINDNIPVTFYENAITGGCNGFASVERFWTAVDACNNAKTVKQKITYVSQGSNLVANYGGDHLTEANTNIKNIDVVMPTQNNNFTALKTFGNEDITRIEVYSFNGQQLFVCDNFGRAVVQLNQYQAGVYIMKISNGKQTEVRKFMRQ